MCRSILCCVNLYILLFKNRTMLWIQIVKLESYPDDGNCVNIIAMTYSCKLIRFGFDLFKFLNYFFLGIIFADLNFIKFEYVCINFPRLFCSRCMISVFHSLRPRFAFKLVHVALRFLLSPELLKSLFQWVVEFVLNKIKFRIVPVQDKDPIY